MKKTKKWIMIDRNEHFSMIADLSILRNKQVITEEDIHRVITGTIEILKRQLKGQM